MVLTRLSRTGVDGLVVSGTHGSNKIFRDRSGWFGN
jgi:hypothetical protein